VRIAIVNQFSSAGGGARFTRALVNGLATSVEGVEIGLFADATHLERDALASLFADTPHVTVLPLHNEPEPSAGPERPADDTALRRAYMGVRGVLKRVAPLASAYRTWRRRSETLETPEWARFALDDQALSCLAKYEVVYLAWPYFIEPVDLPVPVVITMHDFNFKYPFGNFTPEMLSIVEREVPGWIDRADVVVLSAEFMRQELERFYPGRARATRVVRLTQFSISALTEVEADAAVEHFGLPQRFMMCASNTASHKNLETLLRAAGEMKRRAEGVPLVLTGYGTDEIGTHGDADVPKTHPLYRMQMMARLLRDEGLVLGVDVFPLGYVSDVEVDALIRKASLVVSPSLYEAGSGPGLDAWANGTPVAFSNIPPFIEHLDFLGVHAFVFDPLDPVNIADTLHEALSSERSAAIAAESRAAIARRTWEQIASEYADAFQLAVDTFAR
jgi:glycosyltransferase involved in cell wall biosynthesis